LIAQWCTENYNYRIIGWGPWVKRTSIARHAAGFREIRELLSYLRSGGRVIIMGDVFNKTGNCPARFLETNCNISVFPVRLAKIAHALVTTQIPVFRNKQIQAIGGPQFNFQDCSGQSEDCKIMQTILLAIEKEIRQDPSIWMGYIRGSLSAKQN
jgi:lauroyl/myristoyl acyltransferase